MTLDWIAFKAVLGLGGAVDSNHLMGIYILAAH